MAQPHEGQDRQVPKFQRMREMDVQMDIAGVHLHEDAHFQGIESKFAVPFNFCSCGPSWQ